MNKNAVLMITLPAAALMVALFALAFDGVVGAASNAPGGLSVQTNNDNYIPGRAALRATINQETGEVEIGVSASSSPLDAELENALRRDTVGLKQVFHPDGSVSVNLEGRFQNVLIPHCRQTIWYFPPGPGRWY